MQAILRQVAGIDVAKDELVVCLGRVNQDLSVELHASKSFVNNSKGFLSLREWVTKMTHAEVPVRYVMEATGVYHEKLLYGLADQGLPVSVVLPSQISNYARSLVIKTVTDKTAAEAIARFGCERTLQDWQRPSPVYKKLRQLTRERDQLVAETTMVKNQLHAEQAEVEPGAQSVARMKKRLALLATQHKQILMELKAIVSSHEQLKQTVQTICSIPGVGVLTAVTVLAETNGFELIRNKRQLTSYAGLDIKEKQSGISVHGKPRISKKGNKYLRKAVHMPALAAIRSDDRMKGIFSRLVGKHGIKMKAVVAVQRKLLEMIYTIYKTNTIYDKDYLQKLESSTRLLPKQAG